MERVEAATLTIFTASTLSIDLTYFSWG